MSRSKKFQQSPVSASVVVATYRRPTFVRECLSHIQLQTVAPVRVIVVDASPDSLTRDVVAEFAGVEYRRNERGVGTTSTSRAIGIADLEEDVVAFIDDDAYAEPEWLEELLKPYADASVGAVGGRALNGQSGEAREGLGEIGLLLPNGRLTGNFAADPGHEVDVDHLLGANMSVRLDAIRAAGGIREFYPGTCLREESDVVLRIGKMGMRIVFAPRAVVHHVAGDYAKGRRFDSRYHYYAARNHLVLLATVFGWRDRVVRRYLRTASQQFGREIAGGVRALTDPERRGVRRKVSGLAGGIRRAGLLAAGSVAGAAAAVRANRELPSNGVRS